MIRIFRVDTSNAYIRFNFCATLHLILSPASEPSAFGTSTESSASGSSKSATSAPNLSDSSQLSVSSSLECEALKLIRTCYFIL